MEEEIKFIIDETKEAMDKAITHLEKQLVKIRVDQGPHNRVDLPFVVINTGSDIDHDAASDWFKAVKAGV